MYNMGMSLNQSIEESVERRRAVETARKARVFNTRKRVMGLDVDALNRQVHEKKHQEYMKKQLDKTFDVLIKCQDQAVMQQDINEKEAQKSLHKDLRQYWATQQRVEDSRDADLKCGLKGAFEITIPEAKLGPASMQIFQGEDIAGKQMRREKITRTERDLRAQMDDDKKRLMRDEHRELQVTKELLHQDLKAVRLALQEEKHKKTARIELDSFNQALAAEQLENLKEQHRREERENLEEISHVMTSDMMIECADVARIHMGKGRPPQILPDRWKGMTALQLRTIYRDQEQQRCEKQRQLEAAKILDAAQDFQCLKLSRETEGKEKKRAELRREQRIQVDKFNMQLAREQQAHQEYLNKKLYTNKPSKDYFHQFNTSSR